MNFSDLFIVVVLASAMYGLVVAVTGRRHFVVKAVNPHRGTWLIAAVSILWVGISLLRWEAQSWNLPTWASLLSQLVTDAPTTPRVKVASVAILLSGVFLILVFYCQLSLPRDPTTYRRPHHRRAAVKYYVTTLRGGLDYALLAWGNGERLEEEAHARQIRVRCPHLPKVQLTPAEEPHLRTVEDQVQCWRDIANRIHQRMNELDNLIELANQGRNQRLVFDTEFGGLFFKYLRLPDPRSKVDTALYLFGATVHQTEMDSRAADQHFHLLLQALLHIDRSIRVQ